ncbi:MAG: bacterial transcriptional activator domain-containing protein [Planctomycetaceae bacterium]|nr:bacterial transcriptional activator domain-containing protein [Planctomycetaceae bacterium]
MPILIPIALLGWIPLTVGLFLVLPARRAAVVSIIGAWLLLPPAILQMSGLPDYDKLSAATLGILLATLIFEPHRILDFRLQWFDLPMVFWCIIPLISSLDNKLGVYDGLAGVFVCIVRWGLPYLVGRLYLGERDGLRDLGVASVIGGIAYIIPIMIELRLSPVLKGWVYGMYQWEGTRFGSYRPWVFLTTGLELGMWMAAVSLLAVWMWKSGLLHRIGAVPVGSIFVPMLLVTNILTKASGALVLLIIGLAALWLSTRLRSRFFLFAMVLVSPLYYAVRIPGIWSGDNLVSFIESIDAERAQSLGFRFICEDMLIARAMQQPVWGWGGWGRSRVTGSDGRDLAATDGLWIINLGYYGCVGLTTWTVILTLPSLLFIRRFPVSQWDTPAVAPLAAFATLLSLYNIDCLANGFLNLVLIAASGGLICVRPLDFGTKAQGRTGRLSDDAQKERLAAGKPRSSYTDGVKPGIDTKSVPGAVEMSAEQVAARYEQLARTLKNQRQLAEAKSAWTHALSLLTDAALAHPETPGVLSRRCDCANDLAWFLCTEPDPTVAEPALAVQLATEATQADPHSAAYWNTLGAAHYRAGDAPSAIGALERSLSLTQGGTGFDYVFLSLSHGLLGQFEQAKNWRDRTAMWLQQQNRKHPELLRLHEQACEQCELQGAAPSLEL